MNRILLLGLAALLWIPGQLPAQAPGVYRELFNGFDRAGSSLWQLTNDVRFLQNNPSSTSILTSFRAEQNRGDDYGQRLRAFVTAPATGNYTFAIASDEVSELFLSSDEDPAHKRLIAWVDPRVQPDNYTTFSWQQSSNILLQAGRRYYVEALHKEANLLDHLAVQWRLPNNAVESPIPAARLTYEIPPLLTAIPTEVIVEEGRPVTWAVRTANFLTQSYRWQRNGEDIPNANRNSFTLPAAALLDHGALFRVIVTNRFGQTNTPEALLTVLRDIRRPEVLRVFNGDMTNIVVTFSEPVEAASALNLGRYTITGVTLRGAGFGDDPSTVILATSPLVAESSYQLSISGVRDLASQPNTITATQVVWVAHTFTSGTLGTPALAGSLTMTAQRVQLSAGGADLGGFADEGGFGYRLVTGDFDYRVCVEALEFTDVWAKAGLLAREQLAAGSRSAGTFATPALAGSFFQYRTNLNGFALTAGSFPSAYPNAWLRLSRVGNQFTGYASRDGLVWHQLGSVTLAMSNRLYFGLSATSHRTNQLTTARFRDFSVAPPDHGLAGLSSTPPEPLGPSTRRTGLVISEIMYHPRDVVLGARLAELQFIELYNSNPFPEDISGYRLSGDIAYTFPMGTILPGGGWVVVGRAPSDLQAVYSLSHLLGPFTNNLPNAAGQVRLRNDRGTVLLEVEYDSKPPWPVAADGAGHSLVLARPSYGEGQRAAWAASDAVGGSPGGPEPFGAEPLRSMVINEFLAHTDSPQLDFIELFNAGSETVDLGGAFLSDSPGTNRFRIPAPTLVPARGWVSFDQVQLGFALSSAGERIFLVNSNQSRVIDALGFNGQGRGVASGRFPDGAPSIQELATPTPGHANAPALSRDVVINEIMYRPISGDADDEFVELYNRGQAMIDLAGWRLRDGIEFTFPAQTRLVARSYLVVARNPARLLANYSQLNGTNTVGGFSGSLRNRGERIALAMPQLAISGDPPGPFATNVIYVDVDEVEYGRGGAWGEWANGGGSSLELIDPRSDNRLGPNWADSDETRKAPWTTLEITGPLDNGGEPPTALHVLLLEAGECLLDNVEVRTGAGPNLVANSIFESGTSTWSMRGNHERSSLATNEGFESTRSLHIRATSRGDIGANKILVNLGGTPSGLVTIRAKVRWLRGWPELLLRLRGSWLEATDRMSIPANLGTPGTRNSRWLPNVGPAITAVTHTPVVPAAGQPVLVTARVADPDGLLSLNLQYRVDPGINWITIPMNDDGGDGDPVAGDGIHTGLLPGQAADQLVAFTIEATDLGAPLTISRFPAARDDNGPVREGLVHFGGAMPASSFGTYRFWITRASITNWSQREVLSNELIPGTFVYGNHRVIYHAGARYSGSPAHQDQAGPDYSPVGTPNHYAIEVAGDDLVLGTDNLNKIHGPGNNHHDDNTLVREITAYWMAQRLGLPHNYKRHMLMFINGKRHGSLMEDTQVPNGDVIDGLFADDPEGDLYKLSIWYEFGPPSRVLTTTSAAGCTLNNYLTTGGAKKRARYRWNWQGRALRGTANDYTNLFGLIDAANTPASGPLAQNLEAVADMEQWMRTFALEHAVGNWDSFGYRNEQNMFAYKPERGRWELLIWDINIIFGGGTRGTPVAVNGDLFEYTASNLPMGLIYNHPQFRRAYWRALRDLVEGPMLNAQVDPVMDARYAAFANSGVNVSSPDAIKTWIAQRRAYIQAQLVTADIAPFRVNTPDSFSSSSNLVAIRGTAPMAVKSIEVNGLVRPITWTSLSNWTVWVALERPINSFAVAAYDRRGQLVPGTAFVATIQYTGASAQPEDYIVLNEILSRPAAPETAFIEILNTSTNLAFDLSNWRLNGADFVFPEGTLLTNRQHLLLVKNRAAFTQTYGNSSFVAGEFQGRLDPGGETLTLERPVLQWITNGTTVETNLIYVVVDRVKYDDDPPWPAQAAGASLQLMDATRDNSRVSNWAVSSAPLPLSSPGRPNSLLQTLPAYDPLWLNEVQPDNTAGPTDNAGQHEPWLELYNAGPIPLPLEGYLLRDIYTSYFTQWAFPPASSIAPGECKLIWADGHPEQTAGTNLHTNFRLPGRTGTVALVRWNINQPQITDYLTYADVEVNLSYGSVPDGQPFTRHVIHLPSAGASNGPARPLVFINEWLAGNTNQLADPADGDFEDWFELYNASTNALDLGGFFLSDTPGQPAKFRIPPGYTIPAKGFLIVWADEETGQNQADRPDLHVNFRLSADGESLALSSPSGEVLDRVSFGAQINDVSEGRFADGAAFISPLPAPTPGAPNLFSGMNTAPRLTLIPDQTVTLGQTLRVFAIATDAESPPQTLAFSLAGAFPGGASIQADTGVFSWRPSTAQTPSVNPILVRVTDNGSPPLSATRSFTVVVVGPPRITSPMPPSDGLVSFSVQVVPGKTYRVEYSHTLLDADWSPLGPDRTPVSGTLVITDTLPPQAHRFYRVSILD